MTVQEVIDWLEERRASEDDLAGVARYGIRTDRWARGFESWDVCDGVCMDLFRHTPKAGRKARE